MGGRVRCAIVLATAVAVLCASPAHAAFPGKNGRIAFAIQEDSGGDVFGGRDIWTMDPDGSDLVRLTTQPRWDILPDWSADGRKIAFVSVRATGGFNVWTMNADGTNQTQVTADGNAYAPTWSPDGERIAFQRNRSVGVVRFTDLWVMNADGSNERRLDAAGDEVQLPAWSPDGSRIAYANRSPAGLWSINTINPDGTERQEVISDPNLHSFAPDWSPDGNRIVFARGRLFRQFGIWDVWVADAGGGNEARIAEFAELPAFSPDGTQISVKRFVFPQSAGVYVMNADGSDQDRVASGKDSSFQSRADWGAAPEPRREDFKNGPAYCRALREHLGEAGFAFRFGGRSDAFGKCVSSTAGLSHSGP